MGRNGRLASYENLAEELKDKMQKALELRPSTKNETGDFLYDSFQSWQGLAFELRKEMEGLIKMIEEV